MKLHIHQKDYEINVEKDAVLSKLSGYLSFCNNNFKNLKIADNKMMDELKNKIKTKINVAYEHITKGYRTQVQTALDFIKNFIKIGVIPDSESKRNEEKDIKKAEKILKDITDILEKYDIPRDLQEFRQKIIKEIENKDGLKDNYDNYEEILQKKQNFINNTVFYIAAESRCRGIFSKFPKKKAFFFFACIPERCRGIFFTGKSFFLKISIIYYNKI